MKTKPDARSAGNLTKYLPQTSLFIILFIIYIWSMPGTVVLEDDGLFILAAYFNGIAHPPGYPLYTLMAHVMTWVPIGSVALRVHMLSALFGALGALVLWWIVSRLVTGKYFAYLAGLSFGLSQVYWAQSIIAEVYTLNVVIVLSLFALAMGISECDDKYYRRVALFIGLLYGLGLSNHWPLLILSTPMLISVLWPHLRRLKGQIVYIIPMIFVGLLPYIWMVVRSQMGPEISFYGPLDSWSDFWFFVSREGYSELDFSPTAGWVDKWNYCGFILQETARQFGTLGAVFIVIGFISQWRRFPLHVSFGLILGYLGSTFFLVLLLGFDFEYLHRNIFRVYPLVAYSVTAIWMVLGVKVTIQFSRAYLILEENKLSLMVSLLMAGLIFISNFGSNYRADDIWAETYAKTILDNLPDNAIIFTDGDLDLTTLGYLNRIQKYRQDITLYSHKGILFSNRLFFPGKNSNYERAKFIEDFLKSTDRPVYYTYGLPHRYGITNFGLFNKVELDRAGNSRVAYAKEEIVSYIKDIIINGEPRDPWEKMHYRLILADYCSLSLYLMENSGEEEENEDLLEWINIVCNTYHGHLAYIELLLKMDIIDAYKIAGLFQSAKELREQIVIKSEAAMYSYLSGEFDIKTGKRNSAIEKYKKSVRIWPHPHNPAHERLSTALDGIEH